jgi:hypothetical protein
MCKQRITFDSHYKNIKIQTNKDKGEGCIENILEAYHDRLSYMTSKHKQVSVVQLAVTMPKGIDPNETSKVLGQSLQSIKKTLNRKGCECQIGWTRELKTSPNGRNQSHYHVGIIKNGSISESGMGDAKQLGRLIAKRSGDPNDPGNVHCCTPDRKYNQQDLMDKEIATAIKIRRDLPHADLQFENAFNKISYDTKIDTKGQAPHRKREYDFTRLPQGPSTRLK